MMTLTDMATPLESQASKNQIQQPRWIGRVSSLLNAGVIHRDRYLARAQYSPQLSYGRHFAPPGPTSRSAAVMILLEVAQPSSHWRECSLPLTVRPPYLSDHPGQVSLPGGRLEKGESAVDAAKREFCEELGVLEFPGTVLGSLSPMWVFHSDYFLTPFVAVGFGSPEYTPCSREVSRLFHLPIVELLKERQPKLHRFSRGNVSWNAGAFTFQQECIWGATAMVLAELACVLQLLDAT